MKVLALVGSNRGSKSTSAALVRNLEQHLEPHRIPVTYFFARSMYNNQEQREEFFDALRGLSETDLLIVCASDYVDSLPAPLINLFENIRAAFGTGDRESRKDPGSLTGRKMLTIVHSGYPEPQQRRPGLEICRFFALTTGMKWCGGLSFGGTSPINGQSLEASGPFGKTFIPALERTAGLIASGSLAETDELILEDVSAMPASTRTVVFLMNAMNRFKAFKAKQDLLARPYSNHR